MRKLKKFLRKISIREIKIKCVIISVLLMLLILSFFFTSNIENALMLNMEYSKNETSAEELNNSNYIVSYVDVGQGNCTYIKLPDGKIALIDAGNVMYGKTVCDFLTKNNVTKIDYLIATHSDSDHIGGFSEVFENFEVVNIYRPFQIAGTGSNAETFVTSTDEDLSFVYEYFAAKSSRNKISRVTSTVYIDFISDIYNETYTIGETSYESNVTVFYDGLVISGENYSFEFFAPLIRDESLDISEYSLRTRGFVTQGYGVTESNECSAIFLFECFNDTFLFTGDAPYKDGSSDSKKHEELDFLASLSSIERENLSDVSVYLAGHHGSSHSTSEELVALINPKFAVISVGVGNNYGHPASEVIFRLNVSKNAEFDYLLRTDKYGTISFGKIDGKLKYSLERSSDIKSYEITWHELGLIIFLTLSYIVVFARPINYKRK